LYLIHWTANEKQFPNCGEHFKAHHIEALIADSRIKPIVDQIEFHLGFMQSETVSFCGENDIAVEAWSPLGTGKILRNKKLYPSTNEG